MFGVKWGRGGGGGCEACVGSEAAMISIEHCDHAKD